ncbi:MAG: efflux RND transporter periplasmic adaptor subunit [Flavobacteriales bacterium]|nr:efflux RND transporter periplasmic adaptor subunit [Flavobacteriales bacterium]
MKKLFFSVGLLALTFAVFSCKSEHQKEEEKREFEVTQPLIKDTLVTKDYVAQIHAFQHIELRALEQGYLQNIYVDEGQIVNKGQRMFKIMPNVYDADVQKMRAEVNLAQIEYNNTKLLADKDVVSKNELALQKAKLDKTKAELTLAQTHLNFTNINAPFSGIMDRLHTREGSLLEEGELLTTLSNNSKMWVYFNVPEAEYLDFVTQSKDLKSEHVKLIMANGKYFNQDGIVDAIEGEFNNETGNIEFRATFQNPQGILRHGETGSIEVTKGLKNAVIIPQKSTFEVLEKKFVFVVDKNNVIKSKPIEIIAELPHVFIVKGLSKNDKFLLEGLRLVKENDKIEYKLVKPEKALSDLELYAE